MFGTHIVKNILFLVACLWQNLAVVNLLCFQAFMMHVEAVRHQLDLDDCKFIVENYARLNLAQLRLEIVRRNGLNPRRKTDHPDERRIGDVIRNWEELSTIQDRRYKFVPKSGRKTKNTPKLQEAVKEYLKVMPITSHRLLSYEFEVSTTVIRKVLRCIEVKPYVCRKMQALSPLQKRNRLTFCRQILSKSPEYLKNVWFSDEMHFNSAQPHVNSRNLRFYAENFEQIPDSFYSLATTKQAGTKFTIWIAIGLGLNVFQNMLSENENRTLDTWVQKQTCNHYARLLVLDKGIFFCSNVSNESCSESNLRK